MPASPLTLHFALAAIGTPASQDAARIDFVVWTVILIVVVLAFGVALMQIRKKLVGGKQEESVSASLIEELRAMKSRGEISEAEFQKARQSWLEKVKPAASASRLAERPSSAAAGPAGELRTSKPASRPAPKATGSGTPPDQGERRAKPGFDLTGAPLPPRMEE